MKPVFLPAVTAISLLFAASAVSAQSPSSSEFVRNTYWGLQIADVDLSDSFDQELTNKAIFGSFGYNLSEWFAVEGTLGIALDDDTDEVASDSFGVKIDTSMSSAGVYGVVKNPGPVFLKARAGLAYTTISASASGFEDESESSIGLSYGFGAGVKIDRTSIELEFVSLPDTDDPLASGADYEIEMITLGFNYQL